MPHSYPSYPAKTRKTKGEDSSCKSVSFFIVHFLAKQFQKLKGTLQFRKHAKSLTADQLTGKIESSFLRGPDRDKSPEFTLK